MTFHLLMDLLGALPEQKETARDQDDVPPGNGHGKDGEEGRGGADDPGQHQQQGNAHEHGEEQAQAPRHLPTLGRQPVHEDGDEDDVVDPQHELQGREREEGYPGFGLNQKFKHNQ